MNAALVKMMPIYDKKLIPALRAESGRSHRHRVSLQPLPRPSLRPLPLRAPRAAAPWTAQYFLWKCEFIAKVLKTL